MAAKRLVYGLRDGKLNLALRLKGHMLVSWSDIMNFKTTNT